MKLKTVAALPSAYKSVYNAPAVEYLFVIWAVECSVTVECSVFTGSKEENYPALSTAVLITGVWAALVC